MRTANIFWYSPEGTGHCQDCAMQYENHPNLHDGAVSCHLTGEFKQWTMVNEFHDHFGMVECEDCGLQQHGAPDYPVERYTRDYSPGSSYKDVFVSCDPVEHHYFASSFLHFQAGSDLLSVLETVKRRDIKCYGKLSKTGKRTDEIVCKVYRVPGPVEQDYAVVKYAPAVIGAEWIETITY